MEFNIASLLIMFTKMGKSGRRSKQGSIKWLLSKIVWLLLLAGMLLLGPAASGTVIPVLAQRAMDSSAVDEITINPGKYQIPEPLLSALQIKLGEIRDRSGGATAFGVGYYEEHARWAWIDLLVANGQYFKQEELGPSFLYFAVEVENGWRVVPAEDNAEYLAVLDSIPRDELSAQEAELLKDYRVLVQPGLDSGALSGDLLFPWSNTQNSWRFSPYGYHAAGFTSLGMETNSEAIDLLPPSSVQPARVLAMQGGTVVKKLECTWNTVLIVRHDGYPDPKRFLYLHIQNGTSPVGTGMVIHKGQYLGDLRTPVFNGYSSNGSCTTQGSGAFDCERDNNPSTGNLCSYSTARHLHLGFGNDRGIAIDGNVVGSMVLGRSYTSTNSEGTENSFTDDFSSLTLNPRWHWSREDPTHWSLTAVPGSLRITTQSKDISGTGNTAPLLLQSLSAFASQDFNLQTRVTLTAAANSQQGGLIVYGDDDNYIKLTYGYLNGLTFDFTKEVAGTPQSIRMPAPKDVNTFYLRISKLGKNYYAYYSANLTDWTLIGTHASVNISAPDVGLAAFNGTGGTSTEIPADFDYFKIDARLPVFSDVSAANPYYPDVEILYANNLTGGCNTTPLMFCPDMMMDRAQSAAFMMRAANGSAYVPNPTGNLFEDDWSKGVWARPWAEAMREANMTAGCKVSPLLYCPWVQLPREQVVIFALKMKYGDSYKPPAATGTLFADMTDPSFYATAWAEQAYNELIIPGCGTSGGKPLFCPKVLVSRGLAAYLIVRAKNLTLP